MRKLGLKLWNINTDFYLYEARKLYNEGVFDYIELYIVPNNLDKLNDWKKINIPFDIHAPHFAHKMNLSKKEFEAKNIIFYKEVKTFADELNAEFIIFHSGTGGNYKETARQLNNFNDNRILIENKPCDTLAFTGEKYYVGAKYKELEYIIKNTGCGFCLDVGHAICAANSLRREQYKYIEKLLKLNPSRVHLSDLDVSSKIDVHLNYGLGNLDFEKLFGILPTSIPITIETDKKSKTDLEDYRKDVNFLKKIRKF